MDSMMEMSGTPWIDEPDPVMLHSSRDYECTLNSTEQCLYQQGYWRFWYEADHRYALPTVGFFCTAIALFTLVSLWNQAASQRMKQTSLARKVTAIGRYLSYRAFRLPKLNWNSAPIGVLLLGAVGALFFFAMTLGPKPYYWPDNDTGAYGDSPPIATRAGWMGLACMPFVFATAGKSNWIAGFTGISHEKLQVFHRWIAYAFYILGLVHAFPFIVYNIHVEGMVMQWGTNVFYWTGVAAILAQTWLTFASFSPIRNWSYEFFKFSHFLAALVFILFFFFHCDYTLSAWDYFIATGVLFSLSWLHSQLRVFLENGVGLKATLSMTTNGFVRVSVPTTSTWKAGQHYFVRFLSFGVHAVGSHPFTACSLPRRGSFHEIKDSELVFYIRPQKGFTERLARYAESHPGAVVRVLLDGPYGGIDMQKLAQSDRSLVIAGGSGSGWAIPLVESHLRRLELLSMSTGGLETTTLESPTMRVILATRDLATRQWFEDAVAELLACSSLSGPQKDLAIEVYHTGDAAIVTSAAGVAAVDTEDVEKTAVERVLVESKSESELSSRASASDIISRPRQDIDILSFRPRLPDIIAEEAEAAATAAKGRQLGVFVCGPLGMQNDVANAVAKQQLAIMKGGRGDIYLHMEHFSWA